VCCPTHTQQGWTRSGSRNSAWAGARQMQETQAALAHLWLWSLPAGRRAGPCAQGTQSPGCQGRAPPRQSRKHSCVARLLLMQAGCSQHCAPTHLQDRAMVQHSALGKQLQRASSGQLQQACTAGSCLGSVPAHHQTASSTRVGAAVGRPLWCCQKRGTTAQRRASEMHACVYLNCAPLTPLAARLAHLAEPAYD
jgi:hypothetical protein